MKIPEFSRNLVIAEVREEEEDSAVGRSRRARVNFVLVLTLRIPGHDRYKLPGCCVAVTNHCDWTRMNLAWMLASLCPAESYPLLHLQEWHKCRKISTMKKVSNDPLSRRERQAMEVLFRIGEATAAQVQEALPDDPSYSATRALLGVLVDKGLAKVSKDAKQHVYTPAQSVKRAAKTALQRVVSTFFGGSPGELVANLLDPADRQLPAAEVARIRELLDAHEKGKKS